MEKTDLPNTSKHEDGDGDGVDLISNMPDDILVLILSRLGGTKEALRSSILSRRWRYMWTAIPSVDLHIPYSKSDEQYENNREFVCLVLGKILVDLDSFRLSCYDCYNMSTVGRWIQMAVAKNVKQLDLRLDENVDIELPHCLVTCASLEVLSLSLGRHRLILPNFTGFSALRVLKLENVELFDDDLVNYFFESCCPMLEDLKFDGCWLHRLDLLCISCPKLKKLTIIIHYELEDDDLCGCLKLSCPKLVSVDFYGQIASNYIVERLYSLKEANIHSDCKTELRLLLGISHVESLITDLHLLYEYIDDARDPTLPNLKTLELKSKYPAYTIKPLIQVLKYCPKLESLSLTLTVKNACSYDTMKLDEAETRKIFTPDVKSIEFFRFNGEKPKVVIHKGRHNCSYVARWGKEVRYSHL